MKPIVESFYNWYSSKITHPKYRWIIILGTMVYLFSPLDISPYVFPIIGWIDDGIVLTLLTTELSRLVLDYRTRRPERVNNQTEVSSPTNAVDTDAVEF
ncbi:MAG: YkvA family protein [Microcystis panniformis]